MGSRSLTFYSFVSIKAWTVTLPSGLQNLKFGNCFKQSLEKTMVSMHRSERQRRAARQNLINVMVAVDELYSVVGSHGQHLTTLQQEVATVQGKITALTKAMKKILGAVQAMAKVVKSRKHTGAMKATNTAMTTMKAMKDMKATGTMKATKAAMKAMKAMKAKKAGL